MVHQFHSKTAAEIFSQPPTYYHVDFKHEDLQSFQAKLKFPGDKKILKVCTSSFSRCGTQHEEAFPVCRTHECSTFYSSKFEMLIKCLDVEVDPIWPWIFIFEKAAIAYYSGKGLGDNTCNTWCHRTHGYSREYFESIWLY